MVTIVYDGRRSRIRDAVERTNELLADDAFYELIGAHSGFDGTAATPAMIADLIRSASFEMSIAFYRSLNPFSKAYTYDNADAPLVIYLNKNYLRRDLASFCNTFIHQVVHAADHLYSGYNIGHPGRSGVGKGNTAPYWIGCLAQRMVSEDHIVCEYLEHERREEIARIESAAEDDMSVMF
jgi:hypothetical protein